MNRELMIDDMTPVELELMIAAAARRFVQAASGGASSLAHDRLCEAVWLADWVLGIPAHHERIDGDRVRCLYRVDRPVVRVLHVGADGSELAPGESGGRLVCGGCSASLG